MNKYINAYEVNASLDSCFRRNDRQGKTNKHLILSFLRKQESMCVGGYKKTVNCIGN